MTTDQIRRYAREKYIAPALAQGHREVRIRVGDVHKALALKNRVPVVVQALESKTFLRENNLVLESKEGPPSGLSTSVVFTYRIGQSRPAEPNPDQPAPQGRYKNPALLELLKLEGVGKETFASLGGGENFIRSERKAFADAIEKMDKERGLL